MENEKKLDSKIEMAEKFCQVCGGSATFGDILFTTGGDDICDDCF